MDIIRDILDRVYGEKDRTPEEIERDLRRDYGGEQVYVPKDGDRSGGEITMRDAAIRMDWQQGERIELIARRYRISRRRIYHIVKHST